MVFGFWSRKPPPPEAGPSLNTSNDAPQAPSITLNDPEPMSIDSPPILDNLKAPSHASPDPPGPADSPSPEPDLITSPTSLYALIASVPPQTLHTYALTHLSPPPLSPFPLPLFPFFLHSYIH